MPPPDGLDAKPDASAKPQPHFSAVISDQALDLLLGSKRADDPTRSEKVCKGVQPIRLSEEQIARLGIREKIHDGSTRIRFPNGIEKGADRRLPDGLEVMPPGARVVATTDLTTIVTDRRGNPLAIHSEDMNANEYIFINGKTIIESRTGRFYLDKNNCQSEALLREANHLPKIEIAFDSNALPKDGKPSKDAKDTKDSNTDKPKEKPVKNEIKPEVKRYLRSTVGHQIMMNELNKCAESNDPLCGLPPIEGLDP